MSSHKNTDNEPDFARWAEEHSDILGMVVSVVFIVILVVCFIRGII